MEKVSQTSLDKFFDKYQALPSPEKYNDFRVLMSKSRRSEGWLTKKDSAAIVSIAPEKLHDLKDCSSEVHIVLIEDVGLSWFAALDEVFQLDPQFVLAYASAGRSHNLESNSSSHPPDMTGKWYTTEISMSIGTPLNLIRRNVEYPWHQAILARYKTPALPLDDSTESPWWKENSRRDLKVLPPICRSKIACYCPTNTLRIYFEESSPEVSAPRDQHLDYRAFKPVDNPLHLPVPYYHWRWDTIFVNLSWACGHYPGSMYSHHCPLLLLKDDSPLQFAEWVRLLDEDLILLSMAEYVWRSSIEGLTTVLSQRRSEALARPGMQTYLPLVDLRRPILGMLDCVAFAIQELPTFNAANRRVYQPTSPETSDGPISWSDTLYKAQSDLRILQQELKDEIHLVLGAVTVQDSDASKQQAERATLLTLVAAVYLPLTLVTSIFGMNIKEIDGDILTYRACLQALAVAIGCTVIFALSYREWRRWRRRREWGPREGTTEEDHFNYV